MKIKALIFDVDGTLADNEETHRCAFNAAFQDLDLKWHWSQPEYARLLATAGGKERLGVYIDSLRLAPAQSAVLAERIPEIHHRKTAHYTRMVASGTVPLRDGVKRLLDEARDAHIPVAIATATTLANIDALLQTHLGQNALDRFVVIGYDDQVSRKKPAPDIYEYVLRQLSAPAECCVAIEDSANGANAAMAAGLFTIVTPSYWTSGEDFSAADLILPSLGSSQHPLPPSAAKLIGNDILGLREIDRQLQCRPR